jgi:hypothetical protein
LKGFFIAIIGDDCGNCDFCVSLWYVQIRCFFWIRMNTNANEVTLRGKRPRRPDPGRAHTESLSGLSIARQIHFRGSKTQIQSSWHSHSQNRS